VRERRRASAHGETEGRSLAPLLWLMAYWGYLSGINGSVAPFLADAFALSDAGMAGLFAWLGLASLGSLLLGREVDRLGRRRVLLGCFAALPFACLASALAPGPAAWVAAQLGVHALGATLLATVTVAVCEQAGDAGRALGQGRAGVAFAAATALPLLLVALLDGVPGHWRIAWALAVLPLVALPALRRALPETPRWCEAAARGETSAARMTSVFEARHRRRALGVLAVVVLVHAAEFATRTWLFYHPVRVLGMAPRAVTPLLVVFGGLGLLGFWIGGRCADAFGRRSTFASAAGVFAISAIGYYQVSLHAGAWRAPVLALSLFGLAAGGNAAMVAFRALATELFPTRLRGTLGGWLAVGAAVGWVAAMALTSLLARLLGGLAPAVALLVGALLPAATVLLLRLPETAGRALPGPDAARGHSGSLRA
jgi:predicted MFS family arabinose efflux permease